MRFPEAHQTGEVIDGAYVILNLPCFVIFIACYRNSGKEIKFLKIKCIANFSHCIGFIIKLDHEKTRFFYI